MKGYAVIEKKIGETPLSALEAFRKTSSELEGVPLTYAGRLDPMASGKLLILIGEECKRRKIYDGLDKEYEFEVLFGFKSDTGDVLGLAESCVGAEQYAEKTMRAMAKSFVGVHTFVYPAFSSKVVSGKPLFHHAIENNLEAIEIPTTDVRIYKMRFCAMRRSSSEELIEHILGKIDLLQLAEPDSRTGSGFRKEEIIARWKTLRTSDLKQYTIAKFRATVSSGTYIRALAPRLAEKLGTCGLAYSIQRTKIGRFFPVTKSFGFWRKNFLKNRKKAD